MHGQMTAATHDPPLHCGRIDLCIIVDDHSFLLLCVGLSIPAISADASRCAKTAANDVCYFDNINLNANCANMETTRKKIAVSLLNRVYKVAQTQIKAICSRC